MSKIVTLKGIVTNNIVERIMLFGGRQGNFDKGYKILDFQISPNDPSGSVELTGKITTIETSHASSWNWSKNTEVAWAAWGIPISTRSGFYTNVDDEVMLVEDIFVDITGTAGGKTNYEVTLEQINITDSQAALSMVNTRAQGSD